MVGELIYKPIGEILESIQYIEWNLLLELGMDGYSEYTLGQIKEKVMSEELFSEEIIEELMVILEMRNHLIHQYFKEKDFVKHSTNDRFLENQNRYLVKFKIRIQNFNNRIIK